MKDILFWILPPIVGAFIGYVTNVVAIKMLFRPLTEVKCFGLRLPFTPGILPRERHKLAESIGQMVQMELLTSEVLRERLAKPEVREKINGAIGAYTGQMLSKPLSFLLEERQDTLPMKEIIGDFINSDVFNSFLEEILRNWAIKKADYSYSTNDPGIWLKSRFRDISEPFIPMLRDLIKSGLRRDMKKQAQGEPSLYKLALEKIVERYPGITLGEFISLGKTKKQNVDSFLTEKGTGALDENIDAALSSVDVKTLVSDRINSLDMIRVEKIVLDVMAGQLKWINFFGGVLGALIGFFQVILSLFMK